MATGLFVFSDWANETAENAEINTTDSRNSLFIIPHFGSRTILIHQNSKLCVPDQFGIAFSVKVGKPNQFYLVKQMPNAFAFPINIFLVDRNIFYFRRGLNGYKMSSQIDLHG